MKWWLSFIPVALVGMVLALTACGSASPQTACARTRAAWEHTPGTDTHLGTEREHAVVEECGPKPVREIRHAHDAVIRGDRSLASEDMRRAFALFHRSKQFLRRYEECGACDTALLSGGRIMLKKAKDAVREAEEASHNATVEEVCSAASTGSPSTFPQRVRRRLGIYRAEC